MAEARGFEPPRRVNALADFESAPFSLLGTPPNCDVTYYNTFLLGWQYDESTACSPFLYFIKAGRRLCQFNLINFPHAFVDQGDSSFPCAVSLLKL